ncbi:hypothetical protein DESPIG_02887 [Desulfovibrio piger ATCC 29098]|uniref:Uncharacterized protein n=1 Tax=Desulfovibrio piger ATCC 29098 TaxID=411464 RepID=B6WXR0_9BACT|nr:hypothetical protein DESPIG_02887 [Desulfovibrio piger ATCC 29098]
MPRYRKRPDHPCRLLCRARARGNFFSRDIGSRQCSRRYCTHHPRGTQ